MSIKQLVQEGQGSFTHNNQKLETTQMSKHRNEQSTDIHNMDEFPKHCTEQRKPDTQECLHEAQEQINLIYGDRTQ